MNTCNEQISAWNWAPNTLTYLLADLLLTCHSCKRDLFSIKLFPPQIWSWKAYFPCCGIICIILRISYSILGLDTVTKKVPDDPKWCIISLDGHPLRFLMLLLLMGEMWEFWQDTYFHWLKIAERIKKLLKGKCRQMSSTVFPLLASHYFSQNILVETSTNCFHFCQIVPSGVYVPVQSRKIHILKFHSIFLLPFFCVIICFLCSTFSVMTGIKYSLRTLVTLYTSVFTLIHKHTLILYPQERAD